MEVPGISAKHAIITDTCRANRSDWGAMAEAMEHIGKEYQELCKVWPIGTDVKFHVILTIERERPQTVADR